MADVISILSSLSIGNADPVDRRLVLSKAEMLAMNPMKMPRSDKTKYFALCSDDNQFYIYDKDATQDSVTGKFRKATVLVDGNSIIILTDGKISIKGYATASQGQMLVKDQTQGIAWVNPVSDASIQQAVQQAQASATQAGTSATTAGNYAGQAIAAKTAIENKIWFGTMAQYNALESVSKTTLYFILDGSVGA